MSELNKGVIGKTYKPVEMEVKQHESIYYALATNDPNPFYINGSRAGGIIAPPMFAVVYAGAPTIAPVFVDKEVGEGFMPFLVHGDQEIEWFKAARPGMKMASVCKILDIEDKGTGELLSVGVSTGLADGSAQICRQCYQFFIRGFGKMQKGPKTPEPEEDKSKVVFESKEHVLLGHSYVYAEPSNDHNLVHVNEDFAKKVGLGGIIIHGLCTMAFTHKAVIQGACGGDPLKVKKFSVRFSNPVRPGDVLTIKGWKLADNLIGFEATRPGGELVITTGRAELGEVAL